MTKIRTNLPCLVSIFPGLESILDMRLDKSLALLTKYATPAELRVAGKYRLTRYLRARKVREPEVLAVRALETAMGQTISVPAERITARIIKELAAEALSCRARLKEIEDEMMELLDRHPDAAIIRSLPGMGTVLTAEMIAEAGSISRFRSADALAAAAGVAPVLRQSGKVRFLRRPFSGNKAPKHIFYQSAFCSLGHPDSVPSTTGSGARGSDITKPSSPSQDGVSTFYGECFSIGHPSRRTTNMRPDELLPWAFKPTSSLNFPLISR